MKPVHPKILTINSGSSSIKFSIYSLSETPVFLLSGNLSGLNTDNAAFSVTYNTGTTKHQIGAKGFKEGARYLLKWLEEQNVFNEVTCIGHRVVYGIQYDGPQIVTDDLLEELMEVKEYDIEHLSAEIELIRLFKNHSSSLLQVACFDTSFHNNMPVVAKMLPLPRRFNETGIHKYGFHGLAYAYLMQVIKDMSDKEKVNEKIILAHLG
jgi:acetate kinase